MSLCQHLKREKEVADYVSATSPFYTHTDMKDVRNRYQAIVAAVPQQIKAEINLSFAVSNRIAELMQEKGLSKKQFADAIGKRPCEVTKWLSGQHNFTLTTLGMLSAFFGQPIVSVG